MGFVNFFLNFLKQAGVLLGFMFLVLVRIN